MTSKQFVFSWSTTSKLTSPPPLNSSARHSTLKSRLGATPVVEMKMPSPVELILSVRKSPWNGRIDRSILESGNGQDVPNGEALPTKSKLPFELPWITVPAG